MAMYVKLLSFILLLTLGGCSLFVSENYFGESWKGHHINELVALWGEPKQMITSKSGVIKAEYKIFNDNCTYIFITDEKGIIRTYKYESSLFGTCKPIG